MTVSVSEKPHWRMVLTTKDKAKALAMAKEIEKCEGALCYPASGLSFAPLASASIVDRKREHPPTSEMLLTPPARPRFSRLSPNCQVRVGFGDFKKGRCHATAPPL